MKRDLIHLGLALASLLVLVVALRQGPERSEDAAPPATTESVAAPLTLRAVPKDAPLLLTLDLEAPHAAALRSLLFDPERELAGIGRLHDVCGYDPSAGVKALTIAALKRGPADAQGPGFAIVAAGDFDQQKLAGCIERLVRARGGDAERQRSGSMTLIRDQRGSEAEVALLDQGLVLISSREHLRQMLQALDGDLPSASTDTTHRSLREAIGGSAPLLATLTFQSDWLRRLLEDEEVERSPLASLRGAALRLDLAEGVALDGLFRCARPDEVVPLQGFLNDLRSKLGPLLRQQGLAELDRFELQRQGADLRLHWKLDQKTLAGLVRRLNQPIALPPPRALPSSPDETIPAKPSP
ncbi:MAG TPA: hypothetical protein VI197_16100 [Polyangiaceae bacterium]